MSTDLDRVSRYLPLHRRSRLNASWSTSHPLCVALAVMLAAMLLTTSRLYAIPATADQARQVIRGWLQRHASPLQTPLGHQIDRIETFADAEGQPAWYVVYLRPSGFVVVAADDEVEPIVAFASDGIFDPSAANPLGALVSRDVPGRLDAVRHGQDRPDRSALRARWQQLASVADTPPTYASSGSVSDLRVAPLVQTRWGQTTAGGSYCYNYYTPNHYPAGCVATAVAQVIRYHQHPTAGIGAYASYIFVDGSYQSASTRGGDSAGGLYDWNQMPLVPDATLTTAQRQAIGALCFDVGVTVNMKYTSSASSAASLAEWALVYVFGYSNAIRGYGFGSALPTAGLIGMLNPDLDAGYPAVLGITGSGGGHAVVCDGYGYTNATLYHHLNLGWTGSQDAWYNLPTIDTSPSFSTILECAYNIYPSGSGEIISGRVLDQTGGPLAGATVTASLTGGGTYIATTNNRGIYALAHVPSASTYTLSVTAAGYAFEDQAVTTGTSQKNVNVSGNRWGADFTGRSAGVPPQAIDSSVTVRLDETVAIALEATDDGMPNPPGALMYIITSLPSHGSLSDSSGTAISAVPCTLPDPGTQVRYSPAGGYIGPDSFQFKASDGGTLPEGGDSNAATVSVTILPGIPATPAPADGQTSTTPNTTLSWDNGQIAEGVTYDLCLGMDNLPIEPIATGLATASYMPGSPLAAGTYYWRVVARSTYGDTDGPLWSFQVVRLPGDITGDGYVNIGDLQALVAAWGSSAGQPGHNPDADLNSDGYVNVGDLQILVLNWGT